MSTTNLSHLSEESLMREYLDGSYPAFEELYRRLSPRVYSYLLKRVGNRPLADDIHQVVFMKFHRSRNQYDSNFAVLRWLFVIAHSALLDHYRKESRDEARTKTVKLLESGQSENVSQNDSLESLNEYLGQLPEMQKQALELRYLSELSYEEIAKKLSKNETTIRQWVSRAIKKLKKSGGSLS